MSAVAPIIIEGGKIAKAVAKQQSEIQQYTFNYDFTRLVTGLAIIFIFAKAIEVYVQITSGATSAWLSILKVFGIATPTNAPQPLVQLVTTGFAGIKYWDLVKGIMTLIILLEWLKVKDNLTYVGHGAFALIIGFFALITIPGLFQKLKEAKVLAH